MSLDKNKLRMKNKNKSKRSTKNLIKKNDILLLIFFRTKIFRLKILIGLFTYLSNLLCVFCSLNCLSGSFGFFFSSLFLDLFIRMRASLSKSDNALSSLTSVLNGRFKRHHSIDDDYPAISVIPPTPNEEKIDLISADHRVPLVTDDQNNSQQIVFEKSLISSEIVVR